MKKNLLPWLLLWLCFFQLSHFGFSFNNEEKVPEAFEKEKLNGSRRTQVDPACSLTVNFGSL